MECLTFVISLKRLRKDQPRTNPRLLAAHNFGFLWGGNQGCKKNRCQPLQTADLPLQNADLLEDIHPKKSSQYSSLHPIFSGFGAVFRCR